MKSFNKAVIGLVNSLATENGKLEKQDWDKVCYLMSVLFEEERVVFSEMLRKLLNTIAESDKDATQYNSIPKKANNSIKALQVISCMCTLLTCELIDGDDYREFAKKFIYIIAPGQEQSCRGYFYRYEGNDDFVGDFIYDFSKFYIIKEKLSVVEKDEDLIVFVNQFMVSQQALSAQAVGSVDEFISRTWDAMNKQ